MGVADKRVELSLQRAEQVHSVVGHGEVPRRTEAVENGVGNQRRLGHGPLVGQVGGRVGRGPVQRVRTRQVHAGPARQPDVVAFAGPDEHSHVDTPVGQEAALAVADDSRRRYLRIAAGKDLNDGVKRVALDREPVPAVRGRAPVPPHRLQSHRGAGLACLCRGMDQGRAHRARGPRYRSRLRAVVVAGRDAPTERDWPGRVGPHLLRGAPERDPVARIRRSIQHQRRPADERADRLQVFQGVAREENESVRRRTVHPPGEPPVAGRGPIPPARGDAGCRRFQCLHAVRNRVVAVPEQVRDGAFGSVYRDRIGKEIVVSTFSARVGAVDFPRQREGQPGGVGIFGGHGDAPDVPAPHGKSHISATVFPAFRTEAQAIDVRAPERHERQFIGVHGELGKPVRGRGPFVPDRRGQTAPEFRLLERSALVGRGNRAALAPDRPGKVEVVVAGANVGRLPLKRQHRQIPVLLRIPVGATGGDAQAQPGARLRIEADFAPALFRHRFQRRQRVAAEQSEIDGGGLARIRLPDPEPEKPVGRRVPLVPQRPAAGGDPRLARFARGEREVQARLSGAARKAFGRRETVVWGRGGGVVGRFRAIRR